MLPLTSACNCDESFGQLAASIEVDPQAIDFGEVPVHGTKQVSLRIKNKGSFLLDVQRFSTDAPFIAPAGTATIGTGGTTEVRVGFTPGALGPHEGMLELETTARDSALVLVPLRGTGIEAAVAVAPAQVDFGEVLWVGGTLAKRAEITVSNPGSDVFDLTMLELAEDGGGAFGLDPRSTVKRFAPGESATFEVSYLPKAMGPVTGSVRIRTTAPTAAELTVPLAGKAVGPRYELCAEPPGGPEVCTTNGQTPRINFSVERGMAGSGRVRVLNTGDRELRVIQGAVTGSMGELTFDAPITGPLDLAIQPGGDRAWMLTYAPQDYTFDAIILSLSTNAPEGGTKSARVEGRVPKPEILVNPRSLTIRNIGASTHGETPVGISSCGLRPLILTHDLTLRQLTGPGPGFSLMSAPPAGTMVPMGACGGGAGAAGLSFILVFDTAVPGNYSAEIDIESNDPIQPKVTVTVGATKS